jgi:hypothetical protein
MLDGVADEGPAKYELVSGAHTVWGQKREDADTFRGLS